MNVPGSIDNSIAFRVLDRYGAPVGNATGVTWKVDAGHGVVQSGAETTTDQYGIAAAQVTLAGQPEVQTFEGDIGAVGYQFTVTAANAPSISAVVNAGDSAAGSFAPGSYITIYGTNLAPTSNSPQTSYLPLSLSGTSVTFDVASGAVSVPGALSYVGSNQVNVQIPWELQGQPTAILKVFSNGLLSFTTNISLSSYAPAFFEYADAASKQLEAVATDLSYQVVDSTHPIARGQYLVLYANGLGPVSTAQFSGYPASGNPVVTTMAAPSVSIGGQSAPVLFSGLAPGFAGLYQLNVKVPSNIGTGLQSMTLAIGGVSSAASGIYVQ